MASTTSPRTPLNREMVLRAGLILVEQEGLSRLSMRKLGQHLGVEAMSLYNHVANKEDLLVGMVDLVMQEVAPPDHSLAPKEAIRASALSAHAALQRHPWMASLVMNPQYASEARFAWMDGILQCLRQAGCSVELTHHVYHALDSHIVGFALWAGSFTVAQEDLPAMAERLAARFSLQRYPYLLEHMRYHQEEPHPNPEHAGSEFEFGLDLILNGVPQLNPEPVATTRE